MRAVFLAIKDYIKDTIHDKICRLVFKIDPGLNFLCVERRKRKSIH